ncbi:F0F1 ATP synthase subunit alpha [Anaerosacchariphilus polymeriproducens]|uniref:Multifunctional fusion protein n=1 Tax=Anaerosacchariphilus polymeriproducens TaxID=1812858 RepID=A0A371AZ48_9FIRM|nr:F0F1 ATP synthase subunit alpha [Anaerosacchariphilus polymeriproducens]RDU24826.1 F0F1 ATP synthase subunit alpha [Anaerosacchariphilus polymeriproducens]
MTKTTIDYAKTLYGLSVPKEMIQQTIDILEAVPQIKENFINNDIPIEKKHNIIDKVFPKNMRDYLKILCDNQNMDIFDDIIKVYEGMKEKDSSKLIATIYYTVYPNIEQINKVKEFLCKKFQKESIEMKFIEDKSLIGGFKIRIGNQEYDWSMIGRLKSMEQKLTSKGSSLNSSDEIITILKSEIAATEFDLKKHEIGIVKWIGDGIAVVDGLDHVMYGEIVIFDTGVKGMVQDIRREEIGCILFGRVIGMKEGTRVIRTGKMAGIPVGENFIGRVVDAQGAPIDGKGEITAADYRFIENEAPGIVERKSVSVPLATGILSIDAMFPIGRGQRELIIGDRQTGKSSITIDTIINQKGKDVICIYVAIGQKKSTISKTVSTLKKYGAMNYSIVVSSTASEPASLQYIAPYSGTALAEYFMYKGKDVLIVYDDLSKHAVAYRALSLLLERSPGREAYPGDVFYLHSRLLERSSCLSEEYGGGSITALPIVETQAGDVSSYIPTNVISITDGQIFLESNLFFSGMRPAVNVGLSVSRVGGAAQTKAMKKVSGSIRIDLAQYREMEIFTQFSADLDTVTQEQLQYGRGLVELLKQPLYQPLELHQQVITLCAANKRLFVDIEISKLKEFLKDILVYFDTMYPEVGKEIEEKKELTDEQIQKILEIIIEYKSRY